MSDNASIKVTFVEGLNVMGGLLYTHFRWSLDSQLYFTKTFSVFNTLITGTRLVMYWPKELGNCRLEKKML